MVDSLEATRAEFIALGVACSDIQKDRWSGHRGFQVTDPDGHVITFVSPHDGEMAPGE